MRPKKTRLMSVPENPTAVCSRVFVPNFRPSAPTHLHPVCTHDRVIIEPQQVEPGREDRGLFVLAQLKEPPLCAHCPHKSHKPSVQEEEAFNYPF